MKHHINRKWYCETKDVQGVNQNTLLSKLKRGNDSKWANIPNPNFNGKNSRRLILIESIPDDKIRTQVLAKLNLSLDQHEAALNAAAPAGLSALSRTATEATSQTLRKNAAYLAKHLTLYLDKEHLQFVGHFTDRSLHTDRMIMYARTAAFASFVFEQLRDIHELSGGHTATFNRDYRSFRMNLITVLLEEITDLDLPTSDQRFKAWCDKILLKSRECSDNPAEWIDVKRAGNKSASRFTKEQKKIAEDLYTQNAIPVNQVYSALVAFAQKRGWWIKNGEFSPINKQTLYNYMNSVKEKLDRERSGRSQFALNNVPTISREYPQQINAVWGFDATAHDEWIAGADNKIRQSLNVLRVFDYTSLRLIATVAYVKGERAKHYIEAFQQAVATTGYAPNWVQTDQGPAYKEFMSWCETKKVKLVPANAGLARAKLVENLLGRMGNLVYRHLASAWSGQNLTAQGKNSRLSPEHQDKRKQGAKGVVRAANWACKEAVEEWNSLIIEQLAKQPCDKTPIELWNEKESATNPIEPLAMAVTYGHHHQVRLTIEGAEVQYTDPLGNKQLYNYFPNSMESEEDIKQTIDLYQKLPHTRQHAIKIHLYISKYGKEAFVFQNAWNGTQPPLSLGRWVIKPLVSMVAAQEGQAKTLRKWLDFAKEYSETAKAYTEDVSRFVDSLSYQDDIESIKNDPLQGRKRKVEPIKPTLDKDRLASEEELWKLTNGDEMKMAQIDAEYDEYVDEDTGEVLQVERNKKDPAGTGSKS